MTCSECHRPIYRRDWCQTHYRRLITTGDPGGPVVTPTRRTGCVVDGCDGAHWARGYCHRHYQQWLIGREPAADFDCGICEDAEFVVKSGAHPYEVARRVGYSPDCNGTRDLRKHLRQHGRADLAERLLVARWEATCAR